MPTRQPNLTEILEAILEGATDAIVVTDARGTVRRASNSVREQLGWAPESLVGQNIKKLVPSPHQERHDDYMARYRETGRTWILGTTREFEVLREDGTLVPCELSIFRIEPMGADAEPCFCGIFRNISERRAVRSALARSEAKFRAVFENENQVVLLLDASGRIVNANRPTFARTSIAPGNVLGQLLDEAQLWGPDAENRAKVARTLARAYETGVATTRATLDVLTALDNESQHTGAREYRLAPTMHELSIRVIDDSQARDPSLHAIAEIRDISGLVQAEERESAVLRSLATIGAEAAVLAHELRHPVSELELALKALSRGLGEHERAILDSLAGRMRRLESLLTSTLSFSRPLEPRPQAVPLEAAVGRVLDRERASLQRSKVRAKVRVEPDTPALSADPAALDDLLANLVRNAAEAQPDGGEIRVEARRKDPQTVELAIEDDGPGIPLTRREDVFRIFHSEKEGGTGIGLALVKKIAVAHGATLELGDAHTGTGLRVTLGWPAHERRRPLGTRPTHGAPPDNPPPPGASPRGASAPPKEIDP